MFAAWCTMAGDEALSDQMNTAIVVIIAKNSERGREGRGRKHLSIGRPIFPSTCFLVCTWSVLQLPQSDALVHEEKLVCKGTIVLWRMMPAAL